MVPSFTVEQKYIDRFWLKVDKTPGHGPHGDCWIWTGAITKTTGYGKLGIGGGNTMDTHRFVAICVNNFDMQGFDACHTCDNRACCRPEHIQKGTRKKNMEECVERDRHVRGSRNGLSKLTEEKVRIIRNRGKESHRKLAKEFGVDRKQIDRICNFETWKHVN